MHKIILMICRALIDLDGGVTVKGGLFVLFTAPGVVVMFIARLMHIETGLHTFSQFSAISVAMFILVQGTFFFILSEKICNEVSTRTYLNQ